jgi:signal transduction histidine kinase
LERLAGTAGLALANVRLTYDLRHRLAESRDLASHLERSRRRLLSADAEQTQRFTDLVEERVRSRLRAVSGCLDRAETGSPDDAVAALEEATGAAATALEELRDIAAGVFPPTLSDNGLRVALETYAQRHDGRVRVAHHGPGRRPPSAVEAAAYLCAVELLEESAATGGGGTVDLGQEDGRLRLCVATDGVPSAATMQLVADRAEASDGVIEPVTDAGTVTVRWAVGEGSGA